MRRKPDAEIDPREKGGFGASTSSLNDLSWYSRNPNILAAAGAFPFPYRPGMAIPLAPNSKNAGINVGLQSMCRLNWVPSFGISNTSTDPASIAAKEFYGRVRAAYSGALDADAPDYLMYVGALDSIYTYIGWLKRVYRAISSYSIENTALPDCVLYMSGFNNEAQIQELRKNKTHFWQLINELILMTRKFKCPAVMDLFNRHYWMSDNIYTDQPIARAQLYMYNLVGVYKLTELPVAGDATNTAMGLQVQPLPTTELSGSLVTVDQLYQFGLSLIKAMDAWDDGYTISGYLMRAFADVPSFSVAELEQGELLTFNFVPEVLTQIENYRTIVPPGVGMTTTMLKELLPQFTVSQRVTDNAVVTNGTVTVTPSTAELADAKAVLDIYTQGFNVPLNIHSDVPSIPETVIASRMTAYADWSIQGTKININYSCGTEVPLGIAIYGLVGNTATYSVNTFEYWDAMAVESDGNDSFLPLVMAGLSQFDWHPLITLLNNTAYGVGVAIYGDVVNITTITKEQISNLHKICLYSELNSFGI